MQRFVAILVLVLVVLASAGCSSSEGGSDGSGGGGSASDERAGSAEDICAWITPEELDDAGFSTVTSQGPGQVTSGGRAVPNCSINAERDGKLRLFHYSVHPDGENEPKQPGPFDDVTVIEGLGDGASRVITSDEGDPETSYQYNVAIGDQNLMFNASDALATPEQAEVVIRQLIEAMRADPPTT